MLFWMGKMFHILSAYLYLSHQVVTSVGIQGFVSLTSTPTENPLDPDEIKTLEEPC